MTTNSLLFLAGVDRSDDIKLAEIIEALASVLPDEMVPLGLDPVEVVEEILTYVRILEAENLELKEQHAGRGDRFEEELEEEIATGRRE